jgi:hypothetical protein
MEIPLLVTGPPPELWVTVADDAPLLNVTVAGALVAVAPKTAAQDAHGAAARRIPRGYVVWRFMFLSPPPSVDTPQSRRALKWKSHAA